MRQAPWNPSLIRSLSLRCDLGIEWGYAGRYWRHNLGRAQVKRHTPRSVIGAGRLSSSVDRAS